MDMETAADLTSENQAKLAKRFHPYIGNGSNQL